MRVKLSLLLIGAAAISAAQVWEKPIAPGLVYRMEIDTKIPRIIHALRFTPGSPTQARVELAGKTIYEETVTKGRLTVSEMMQQEGAIAGINGDFFPYTGDPLGAMIRSGELVSIPSVPRASMGWKNEQGSGAFGIMSFKGSYSANGNDYQLDNLNGECPANSLTLNTETAAFSLSKTPNVHVIVKVDDPDFTPGGTTRGTVQSLSSDIASVAVPHGCVVLTAQGSKINQISSLRAGDSVTVRLTSSGIDWRKVDQLISGGPFLVKDGVINTNWEAEKFRDDFTKSRHPRSACGRTSSGDFWFVAVDGRQTQSDGATIREMGEIMFNLGCRDAINLDGGGSTDMNILGVNVNRPSEGSERPVANGVFFYAPKPAKTGGSVSIDGAPTVNVNNTLQLKLMEGKTQVPDCEVLWSAQGSVWIDQGGLIRPLKNGSATITAYARGQVVTKQIAVTGIQSKPNPRDRSPASRGGDRTKRGGG